MQSASPDPHRPTAHDIFCAVVYAVALAFLLYFLVSCGASKPTPATISDSVRVEIRERIVHDTAYFAIAGDFQSQTIKDTASHLQSEYAASDASIEGGLLRHSLRTFPKTVRVPVTVTVHDTLIVERQAETIVQEVPRQPTRWENFVEVCGYILFGIVALCLIGIILKFALRR